MRDRPKRALLASRNTTIAREAAMQRLAPVFEPRRR